ncbi:hypothetical protein CH063_11475 [Colletotrichum higginsianum]|uniref:Uncharacterized protein n=1 Tax=Colletotrichum higginsianum (strain IMI 349063) TaxID=759273 RepID=H1VLJ0_COLHI|nr:hypothetical protein CH63R_14148 [Colletotrichum higginsianum IMI 349063]OBR02922.1 hypothetical protein CH63R_14148 [Colletotrichum higginsianum IMI 349063]CCF41093.1 hypothetical protein CH063_11475 [Colletotrichum higginsianum]
MQNGHATLTYPIYIVQTQPGTCTGTGTGTGTPHKKERQGLVFVSAVAEQLLSLPPCRAWRADKLAKASQEHSSLLTSPTASLSTFGPCTAGPRHT